MDKLVTSSECLKLLGSPYSEKTMVLFDVPTELEIGVIPKKIYCNRLLVKPLTIALENVKNRALSNYILTWDGCFNIRSKRGATTFSLHSWGLAIDINSAYNRFGSMPTMDPRLVKCFTDAGFHWGGKWDKPDGMHFQIARLEP